MYILLWIMFGGIVGWVASIITKNNSQMGLVANIVVGLIGSVIGSVVASLLQIASLSSFSFWGFCFAVLGAVILLSLINLLNKNRHRS